MVQKIVQKIVHKMVQKITLYRDISEYLIGLPEIVIAIQTFRYRFD